MRAYSFYQKVDQLSVKNPGYQGVIEELFHFLVQSDDVHEDITTKAFLPRGLLGKQKRGVVTAKSTCILSGLEEVAFVVRMHTKLTPKILSSDGSEVKKGSAVFTIDGEVNEILAYERTILNIIQRMSGIATETARYVEAIKKVKGKQLIAATRKTPWMHLDKKAVAMGGGVTHRLNLHDGILLKDNHLAVLQQELHLKSEAEAIFYALENATMQNENVPIEVEVKTEEAALVAIELWQKQKRKNPFIILLDNFTPKRMNTLLGKLKKQNTSQIFFEVSGGVNLENIAEWAKTDVDVISIGALTHSPNAADFSLDIV